MNATPTDRPPSPEETGDPIIRDVDPLSRLLLRMAARFGGEDQYRLLVEHADLISRLLSPVAPSIAAGTLDLEFGIGTRLDLKINVISKGTTPTTGLAGLVGPYPRLAELTRLIARHRLSYQYGIRIAPGLSEVRVYPNENDQRVLAKGIFREFHPESASGIKAYHGYGLTSDDRLSIYSWSKDESIREHISLMTGIRFEQGFRAVLLWEQARFNPHDGWVSGKSAVQTFPFPIWIINRAISALRLPYFTYFVNQPGLRNYGYLAREGDFVSLYAPMRWG